MSASLRDRWNDAPWREVRAQILSADRPPIARWDETNMTMPWPEDLRGIDLRRQLVSDAVLYFWNMADALVDGATFRRCFLCIDQTTAPSFRGSTLEGCSTGLWNARAIDATGWRSLNGRFGSSFFHRASLVDAVFEHDDWSSTLFEGSDLRGARFTSCNLHSIQIRGSDLTGTTFEDCMMRAAALHDVSLRGARLLRCDLRDATLDGVDLSETDLTGSRLPVPRR